MKKVIQTLIFSSISLCAMANKYNPKKISNSDLRSSSIIFSVEQKSDSTFVSLSKSAANHYFLTKILKGEKNILKISHKNAQELDDEFVSLFINVKHMSASFSGKNCSIFYRLSMRGERTDICKSEKVKIDKINSIFSLLEKYFK